METTEALASPAPPATAESLSLLERAAAVFTNPPGAWKGLESRAQWWFPLVLMMVFNACLMAVLHERAILPMITERWEQLVEQGQLSPEQLERMEASMRGPLGAGISAGQQVIAWPIIMLLLAAGITFGVGFVLGTRMRFRHAFEVVNWSSLVLIPQYLLMGVLAWTKESMQGIHLGFGFLVPQADPPQRLQTALAAFLDAIGPFNLWCLAVVVIGASALSGAPRKSVAWVLGGLFLALAVFMAALSAMFTPGG